jgi:hypothetical protein
MFRSALTTRGKLYQKKGHIDFGRHFEFLRKQFFHRSWIFNVKIPEKIFNFNIKMRLSDENPVLAAILD